MYKHSLFIIAAAFLLLSACRSHPTLSDPVAPAGVQTERSVLKTPVKQVTEYDTSSGKVLHVRSYIYDVRGQVTEIRRDTSVYRIGYNVSGKVESVYLNDYAPIVYSYDSTGLLLGFSLSDPRRIVTMAVIFAGYQIGFNNAFTFTANANTYSFDEWQHLVLLDQQSPVQGSGEQATYRYTYTDYVNPEQDIMRKGWFVEYGAFALAPYWAVSGQLPASEEVVNTKGVTRLIPYSYEYDDNERTLRVYVQRGKLKKPVRLYEF